MSGYRKERLEEQIKRIVAETLLREINDPRIGFVTVTKVELNRDFSIVKIWVSVIGDEKEKRKTIYGLISAGGFIQHKIGKGIRLKNTPNVKFCLDTSIEDGVEMVNILNRLDGEMGQDEKGEDDINSMNVEYE